MHFDVEEFSNSSVSAFLIGCTCRRSVSGSRPVTSIDCSSRCDSLSDSSDDSNVGSEVCEYIIDI